MPYMWEFLFQLQANQTTCKKKRVYHVGQQLSCWLFLVGGNLVYHYVTFLWNNVNFQISCYFIYIYIYVPAVEIGY